MNRGLVGLVSLWTVGLAGCAGLSATQVGHIDQRQVEYARIDHGSPVVVFENGLGASMTSWERVFPVIGREATVFAYNRPSYGRSEAAPTPRDGAHIVDELRVLLRERGLAPPYVLVGHSLGGLYMQLFARKYPDEVAGLVLVDSTHPTQWEAASPLDGQPWWVRGLMFMFLTGQRQGEFDAVRATGAEVLALPTVTDKPVVVLSAIDHGDAEIVKRANRKRADFPRLYPGCRQQWIESGHFIQHDRPAVVIDAIEEVLAQVRPGGHKVIEPGRIGRRRAVAAAP
jgi:pimeloyl-ACP methyl ester carboxylesterase